MGVNKWRAIWNCPTLQLPLLSFQCPESWTALPDSGDPCVRHCPACEKQVHLCQTPEEFIFAGEQGHCVAVPDMMRPLTLCTYQVGQPSETTAAEFKAQLGSVISWWTEVIERCPDALGSELESMRDAVENRKNGV